MDHLQFAVDTRVRKSDVITGLDSGVGDIGVVHAERPEDALANVLVPGDAGDGGDDLAGRHVEKVVVSILAPKTGGRLHEAQLVDDFFAGVGRVRPEKKIAFPESQAAAMGEQIADGHLVGDIRIVHDEAGEMLIGGIIPGELAFVNKRGERCGGEGFRVGADAEKSEFVDRSGISEFTNAVAFGHQNLAVFHNGDGHAGDIEGLHRRGDVGVEIGGKSIGG